MAATLGAARRQPPRGVFITALGVFTTTARPLMSGRGVPQAQATAWIAEADRLSAVIVY